MSRILSALLIVLASACSAWAGCSGFPPLGGTTISEMMEGREARIVLPTEHRLLIRDDPGNGARPRNGLSISSLHDVLDGLGLPASGSFETVSHPRSDVDWNLAVGTVDVITTVADRWGGTIPVQSCPYSNPAYLVDHQEAVRRGGAVGVPDAPDPFVPDIFSCLDMQTESLSTSIPHCGFHDPARSDAPGR
ncbi:MAG: hypothetical protein WBF53_11200, partial [Litorimonas sp.]